MQLVGKQIVPVPQLVLGDPAAPQRRGRRRALRARWIELMARLGFLRRNENWSKLFERFVEDCDRDGVWHPHKGFAMPRSSNPWVWPTYPLEPSRAGDERWTDMTFRTRPDRALGGRPIES